MGTAVNPKSADSVLVIYIRDFTGNNIIIIIILIIIRCCNQYLRRSSQANTATFSAKNIISN